jgi:hypothetical protein
MQNTRVQNVSIEKIVGTCNYLTRMIESFRGYRLSGLSRTLYFALNLDLVLDTCLYFALHLDWVLDTCLYFALHLDWVPVVTI